uniref:ARAD1C12870p n=1 Tax=Blastobotrys adeninivorans TaxID=409370 RepID=A0A060T0F7_BLAAD
MDSGSASRARPLVKRSRPPSISKLPDEILLLILEYVALFDGSIRLRLVCRRFDAILASLLLSSISVFVCTLPSDFDYDTIELPINRWRKSAVAPRRICAPLCPIDSHIRHVTVQLSHFECSGNYNRVRIINAYDRLLLRIAKHMPGLKSVRLLHDLNEIHFEYSETRPIALESSQSGMDTLIASALNCIPANVHVEVELVVFANSLDGRSVSLRPADWTSWQHDAQFYHPLSRKVIEQWPKSIEEVWGMIDSLDIGARITSGNHRFSPRGIRGMAQECISNRHIFHLLNRMVPATFLSLQFPRGFPSHLKKLRIRNPLIVNCTEVLHFLRNCQYLKDLSLFVVFNIEEAHEHGLPPALETLELFESGGTILPSSYAGLRQFRYTFIGEPRADHMSTVHHFIECSHIPRLALNIVSSSDLKKTTSVAFPGLNVLWAQNSLGRYLLQKMSCDYFQLSGRDSQSSCRISKSATRSLKEYIVSLARSSC